MSVSSIRIVFMIRNLRLFVGVSYLCKTMIFAFTFLPGLDANSQNLPVVLDADRLKEIRKDNPEAFCEDAKQFKRLKEIQRSRPLSSEQKIAAILISTSIRHSNLEVLNEVKDSKIKSVTTVIDQSRVNNKTLQSQSIALSYSGRLSLNEVLGSKRQPMTCIQITPDPLRQIKSIRLEKRVLVANLMTDKICSVVEGQEIGRHGGDFPAINNPDEAARCIQDFDSMRSEQLISKEPSDEKNLGNQAK